METNCDRQDEISNTLSGENFFLKDASNDLCSDSDREEFHPVGEVIQEDQNILVFGGLQGSIPIMSTFCLALVTVE